MILSLSLLFGSCTDRSMSLTMAHSALEKGIEVKLFIKAIINLDYLDYIVHVAEFFMLINDYSNKHCTCG